MRHPITHKAALLFLCLALLLASCKDPSDMGGKNPLWKVTSDKATLYLLGSVHLLKSTDYPMSEVIEQAFMESSAVVFELDIKETSTPEARDYMLMMGALEGDMTLDRVLSPAAYASVEQAMRQRRLDIKSASRMDPWFLATILTQTEYDRLGFDPDYGLDLHYYTKAITGGKRILALETLKYQAELLNSMSYEEQEAFVLQSIRELGTLGSTFPDAVEGWKQGDMSGVIGFMEPCREFPDTCRMLIAERSLRWLERIEGFLEEDGKYMVIVGAAHMVGKSGLVSLLLRKGYRVEQL